MARLLDLPNEILQKILICAIDPDTDFPLNSEPFLLTEGAHKEVAQVRLVNHRFDDLARPLKLRHWADTFEYGTYGADESLALELAIRLLRNPELRLCLRHIEFRTGTISSDSEDLEISEKITENDLHDLAAQVDSFYLSLPSQGFQSERPLLIERAKLGGIPALILEWATNVTSLALTIPFFDPEESEDFPVLQWLSSKLRPSQTSPAPTLPLGNLRDVYLGWGDTEGFFPHGLAAPFYLLKSLRRLYAYRIGHEDLLDNASGSEDTDGSDSGSDGSDGVEVEGSPKEAIRRTYYTKFGTVSDIVELHFVEADLSSNALGDLISHCRRLRSIRISWSGSMISNEMLNSNAWGYLLKLHADSLEVLELDFSESDHEWIQQPYRSNRTVDLGESLGHLHCLRKLKIEIYYVRDDEAPPDTIDLKRLPATLEVLTIVDDMRVANWQHHLDTVEDYISRGPTKILEECKPEGRLPKIRTLDFTQMLQDDADIGSIAALKKTAKEQGIELKLKIMPRSSGLVFGAIAS